MPFQAVVLWIRPEDWTLYHVMCGNLGCVYQIGHFDGSKSHVIQKNPTFVMVIGWCVMFRSPFCLYVDD